MTSPRRRRRGSFLVELLVITILLGIVLLVTSEIFISANRVQRDARKSLELNQRVDTALDLLRRDAWSASRTAVTPDGGLTLNYPDGTTARWSLNAAGDLSREAADLRTFKTFPPIRFRTQGPLVFVDFLPAPGKPIAPTESITLPSQQLLASVNPGGPRP